MKRYFLRFSYVGSNFRSCVKQSKDVDRSSVVGALEIALQEHCSNVPKVQVSSRTDAGVHGLENTAHVDLDLLDYRKTEHLPRALNRYFISEKIALRVLDTKQVASDFHARYGAKQRIYLYRLAVPRVGQETSLGTIPISEWHRCYFSKTSEFNIEALQSAIRLFPGMHNFSAFTGRPTHQERSPIRVLDAFSVQPGRALLNPVYDPLVENYHFWDFIASGRSFVYRQVRRMVSALLAVAQGKLTVDDVQKMLTIPSPESWNHSIQLVPADGLHLIKVVYDPADFSLIRNKTPLLDLVKILDQHRFSLEKSTLVTS